MTGVHAEGIWPRMLQHSVMTGCAYVLAWLIGTNGHVGRYLSTIGVTLAIALVIRGLSFELRGIHRTIWRYMSAVDLIDVAVATTVGSLVLVASTAPWSRPLRAHPSVYVLDWLLVSAIACGTRVIARARFERHGRVSAGRRAVIVGAGDGCELLIREMRRDPALAYEIVGVVDDNPARQGRRIHGVPVLGPVPSLSTLAPSLRFEEILIAIPGASDEQLRGILVHARACAVPVKTVPALGDLVAGRARIGNLSLIEPGDLLDRPQVELDTTTLMAQLSGRPVMVTGAAGSIGSELCRQLVAFDPDPLIMFDRAESALYLLQLELQRMRPSVPLEPIIGDITDEAHIAEVMDAFRPGIVYHAAAYKHVPLMESAPIEAARNNVLGTRAVVRAVERSGVGTVVVISTDKAVRPKSVMGMTKRVAEDIALSSTAATPVVVRFGNVLGSDGSVFPIFQRQLDRGGPVTVTDPAATRYFMSIPDAARLVLQASVMSSGGSVYLLDMGDPVRISDLARDMIHLSGFRPEDEIAIETIGLRPGEKVHEELVRGSETLRATAVRGIFSVEGTATAGSALLIDEIRALEDAVKRRDANEVAIRLKAMVAEPDRSS